MVRLVVLIALAWATPALAKPRVAIAPLGGDADDEVTEVLVEVMGESAKVIKPKETVKAIGKLGISGDLDAKDAQKLQKQLKADAVIQGRVRKDGKAHKLKLTVFAKGKKPSVFSIEFKSAKSEKLRDAVREQLAKRLDGVDDEDEENDRRKREEDAETERKKQRAAEEADEKRKKKQREDDEAREEKKRKRRGAEDDDEDKKKKKRVATTEDDDDGEKKVRKKKRRDDDEEQTEAVIRTMVRVDGGTSFGVRRLTYTGANSPPRVGTFGYGVRIEGELYPFAQKPGGAGGLGLAGEYDKTLGLAIEVPGGKAPIDQQHFSIGGRYRFGGAKSFTLGLDFAKRKYVADRSQLGQPTDLDAPDVNYTAIAPNVALRTPAGAKAAVFGSLAGLLILDTGPIQDRTQYGAATVYGAELAAGIDIAVAKSVMLRFAGELTQISFKFKGNGSQSMVRGVTAAADRTFGLAATIAMTY